MANYVLEILDGDRAGEVLPVTERTLRIGRKAGNDVVLADEKTSGVHCEIAPEGDRFVLRDLGSTNGTFLDGKRVTELVLTPGDIVTVGRLRVKFCSTDTAAAADAGEFAVRRLDASRVQKRGGALGLVAALVVVLGAGGGFWWWQGQQEQQQDGPGRQSKREPLTVTGNKLDGGRGTCETEEGWELRAAGCGFHGTSAANTGRGAFEASRDGDAGAVAAEDFAILRLAQPVTVHAGRPLLLSAHCQTSGGARIGVRASVSAQSEQVPFHLVSGTALEAREDGWQRLEVAVAVPPGFDRLDVEVVALLPGADAVARVDDLAVVEGGAAAPIELRHAESGQTAVGFGAALAVRSTDSENLATLLAVTPGQVPAPFAGLHAAGHAVLSDLGATLACSGTEKGLALAATGVSSLCFVVPADAAGGILVAGADERFASTSASSTFDAQQVLLGNFATRMIIATAAPASATGVLGGGLYRLTVAAADVELRLGFRKERQDASAVLREAEQKVAEGQPGQALDELTKLMSQKPMDSELLGKAQALRTELLTGQADRLRKLQQDLEEADFFSTRGGFERVVAGVDELVELYGADNLEDPKVAAELEQAARARLDGLDGAAARTQRTRLQTLADAFAEAQESGLQKLVADYIDKQLPAPAPGTDGDGQDGNRPDENRPQDGTQQQNTQPGGQGR
ncbi:MAG: FHA domain-containing protein [Planctomycetes bacterium]|nr:FHA domain-containing protein [Planctomycetota bacterium]